MSGAATTARTIAGTGRAVIRAALQKRREVRGIVRAWRELTRGSAGGRTLVACSGGADSAGLLAALATATDRGSAAPPLLCAHVVHDLRARPEARADRDFVQGLCERLGVEFVETEVRVREPDDRAPRNLEARARALRYAALQRLAAEHGCVFIATAHHADDQLETVLMALARGAGVRGLSGMASSRRLGSKHARPITLIRPMLAAGITREDARQVCRAAGIDWREDATNADTSRVRAAVRHEIVPALRRVRARVAEHAAASAEAIREAAGLVRSAARVALARAEREGDRMAWARRDLRALSPGVLYEAVRAAHIALAGRGGLDSMSRRAVLPVVRAIRDSGTEARVFELSRVTATVTARSVTIARREGTSHGW